MPIILVLGVLLALPRAALADNQVVLQAKVEPAFPVLGQDVRLNVLAKDRQGRPLGKARVVATTWMESRENPGMPEMPGEGANRSSAVRIVAMPQKNVGEYVLTAALPMSGRWRFRVWVNSLGATGKADLELDVISAPPPQGTNWGVVGAFLVLIVTVLAVGINSRRRAQVDSESEGSRDARGPCDVLPAQSVPVERADLLQIGTVARLFKSRWYPAIFQVPVFLVFAGILYFLFAGPPTAHDNLGSALVWIVWWPILPLLFLVLGRFWCAVCPMSGLSDFVQRFIGKRKTVPRFLKRWGVWMVLGAFLVITWLDSVAHIVDSPISTAYLLLLVTAGVALCGMLFERRSWCRYLCFIGGMSSNYAMSSMLELRGDEATCRDCRSYECVRGAGRVSGCPMFEFPRTMESNRHCNLCGNCIKTCSRDALRLRVRLAGEELWGLRRRRWEEAIFASALLGIVAVQTIVMLDQWDGVLAWLRRSGIESYPFALTLVLIGAVALFIAAVAAASLVSGRLSGARLSSELVSYSYALIPLGLGAHLAHNLNHLLGEALAVLKSALMLVGLPLYVHPALVSESTIRVLQVLAIVSGTVMAVLVVVRLGLGASANSGIHRRTSVLRFGSFRHVAAAAPHIILVLATSAVFFWMFSQSMVGRMQMSAMAHDDVTPAQIERAKVSVREFVGRNLDLSYVHLEEHGYRDIILKSGEDYYFVDAENYLVASTFSERRPALSNYQISREDAERIALDFALKHYPNFHKNDLQPEDGPRETSPFIGGHVFKWQQYVDGVPTPNAVKIITDRQGRVAIYSAREALVTVPTNPTVDRDRALRVARETIDYVPAKESISLDIGPDLTGRQMLRWTILLRESASADSSSPNGRNTELVLDALTGEVTSILEWS